jgi:hypothetical protein
MNNILQHQQGSVIIASLAKQLQTKRLEPNPAEIVKFAGQFVLQKFIQSWKATGARTLEQGNQAVFETPKYGTLYELWVEFKISVELTWGPNSQNSYVIIPPLLALELLRSIEWQKKSTTRLSRMYPEQILQKVLRMPHHKRRRYIRAMGGLSAKKSYGSVTGNVAGTPTRFTTTVRLPLMFDMFDDPRTQPDTLATTETQFMLEGRSHLEWMGKVDSTTLENYTYETVGQAAAGDPVNHASRGLGSLITSNFVIEDLDFHYYYRIYRETFRTNLRRLLHKDSTSPARYMEFSYYLEASPTSQLSELSYIAANDVKYEGIVGNPVLNEAFDIAAENAAVRVEKYRQNRVNLLPNPTVSSTQANLQNVPFNETVAQYASKNPTTTRPLSMEVELRCDQPITCSVIALRFGKNNSVLRSFYRHLFAAPSLHTKTEFQSRNDYRVRFMEASSVLWEATRDSLGWESEMTGLSFHESMEEITVGKYASNTGVLYDTDVNLDRSPPLGYIVIDWGQFFKYRGMRTAITLKNLSNPKFVIDIPVLVDNLTVSRLIESVPIGPTLGGNPATADAHEVAAFSKSVMFQSPLDARFRLEQFGTKLQAGGGPGGVDAQVANYAVVSVPPVTKYDFHLEVYHQVLQMMTVTYDPDFRNSVIDAEVEN